MLSIHSINKSQEISLQAGSYFFQLWGAQGGTGRYNSEFRYPGGRGAYVSAVLNIKKETRLFLNIGSRGSDGRVETSSFAQGGWNGGGNSGRDTNDDDGSGGGGGATDVRLSASVDDRIMVAAGGSGSTGTGYGAPGGDSKCYTVTKTHDPDAIEGNEEGCSATLGQGETGRDHVNCPSSGAGGGFYGGKAIDGGIDAEYPLVSYSGSSFVVGLSKSNEIEDHLNELLQKAGIEVRCPIMQAGFEQLPSPSGALEKGHEGNGCISIIFLGPKSSERLRIFPIAIELTSCLLIFSN